MYPHKKQQLKLNHLAHHITSQLKAVQPQLLESGMQLKCRNWYTAPIWFDRIECSFCLLVLWTMSNFSDFRKCSSEKFVFQPATVNYTTFTLQFDTNRLNCISVSNLGLFGHILFTFVGYSCNYFSVRLKKLYDFFVLFS